MDQSHMGAVIAAMFAVVAVVGIVALAVACVICYLISGCYAKVPEKFRAMTPGKVWLMLIPLFNFVWIFYVFPGLAKSYKAYFDSVNDPSVGDCGAQIGLWYCICVCCCIVPFLNYLTGLASLVLLILFLVKAFDLKNKIKAA